MVEDECHRHPLFLRIVVGRVRINYGLAKSHISDGFEKSSRDGRKCPRNEAYLRYAELTRAEA